MCLKKVTNKYDHYFKWKRDDKRKNMEESTVYIECNSSINNVYLSLFIIIRFYLLWQQIYIGIFKTCCCLNKSILLG